MQLLQKNIKWIFLLAATIFLELWLSNDITAFLHPENEFVCVMEQSETSGNASIEDGKIKFSSSGDSFTLDFESEIESQNIYLDFESEHDGAVFGNIEIKDDSHAKKYEFLNEFTVDPGGKEHTLLLPLHSSGNITSIRIELTSGIYDPVMLNELVINHHTGLQFRFVRWLIMVLILAAIFAIKHFGLLHKTYDSKNFKHFVVTACIWTFNLLLALGIARYAHEENAQDIVYPLEDSIEEYSIMVRQFDAFQKGQLNLDITTEYDLEDLDNPYDYSERLDAGNHWWNVWDHVYSNGKYYSYFGVAPILTIYYPHYWLTGKLPSDGKTAYFLAIILITAGMLLIHQAIKFLNIKANALAVFLSFLLLPSASYMFLVQSSADIYYIPILSAAAFLAFFSYASLKAYERKEQTSGIVWFVVAGVTLVLSVSSRPTTAIPFIALAAPLYLHILFDKKLPIRQKSYLVTGFVVPVCLGAGLLMWYNHARFGSALDFGIANQLTISDIHYNHISVSAGRIVSYITQYWLLFLRPAEVFPYINYGWTTVISDGSYVYHQIQIGILAMPINYMIFTTPFAVKRTNIPFYKRAMLLCGIIGSVLVLYMDYCLGGIHLRYVCDASFLIALLSILLTLYVLEKLEQRQLFFMRKVLIIVMLMSLFTGYLLIFTNERNYIRAYSTDFYLQVQNLFTIM